MHMLLENLYKNNKYMGLICLGKRRVSRNYIQWPGIFTLKIPSISKDMKQVDLLDITGERVKLEEPLWKTVGII